MNPFNWITQHVRNAFVDGFLQGVEDVKNIKLAEEDKPSSLTVLKAHLLAEVPDELRTRKSK